MIQDIYQKTAKFAAEKHSSQKIPGSTANYMLHLSNVAMEIATAYFYEPNFNINNAIQIALLHDTCEDTETHFKEIEINFGEIIAQGVKALTKNDNLKTKDEKIKDSVTRLQSSSKEAKLVKLADRITNLQKPPSFWSKEKIKQYYNQAKFIYKALNGENKYLDNRLKLKIKEYQKYI